MVKKTFLKLFFLLLLPIASAHEVYVLDDTTITTDFAVRGINVLDALETPGALQQFLTGAMLVALGFILLSYLIHTKLSKKIDERFDKTRKYAHLIIRLGIGLSFLWGALHDSILGPELPLENISGGMYWKPVLIVIGLMLILGAFTRIAAIISLVAFMTLIFDRGHYMINYLNYFGEIIVLILERGELFSMDKWIKWPSHIFHHKLPGWIERLEMLGEKYSFPIIRISFGVALIYAALSVKILHPALSLDVLHNYDLDTKVAFTTLFVVLAAGIIEILLGLILALGVLYRTGMVILVFFVAYSVWFFGEAVWPHVMLVSLGIGLFLHGTDKWCLEDKFYKLIWDWTRRFRKDKGLLTPE